MIAWGKVITEIAIIENRNNDILISPKFISKINVIKNTNAIKVCGINNLKNLNKSKLEIKDLR